jgi:hypothetical protein
VVNGLTLVGLAHKHGWLEFPIDVEMMTEFSTATRGEDGCKLSYLAPLMFLEDLDLLCVVECI